MLAIKCPSCGTTGQIPESNVRQQLRCKACQQAFVAEASRAANRAASGADYLPSDHAGANGMPASPTRNYEDAAPQRGPAATFLVDLLLFRRMIAPVIIQILFWLGVLVSLGTAILIVVSSLAQLGGKNNSPWPAIIGALFGLFIAVVGPIAVRLYCECLILFFRMNETLTDIKNGLPRR